MNRATAWCWCLLVIVALAGVGCADRAPRDAKSADGQTTSEPAMLRGAGAAAPSILGSRSTPEAPATVESVLSEAYGCVVSELGDENTAHDIRIHIGAKSFAYRRRMAHGLFDSAACRKTMQQPGATISCLCFPIESTLYTLTNQLGGVVGGISIAPNHNAISVYDAGGRMVGHYRFQKSVPSTTVISSIVNTCNLEEETQKWMRFTYSADTLPVP